MNAHADLLGKLLPLSYDPTQPRLRGELVAEGQALDAALAKSDALLGAITPYFAGELLPDWERVLGLTPAADATDQQRVQAAVAKIAQTGGLSIPYFTQLAAQLGYTIEIEEPQPAETGISHCGDTLYIDDVIWVWGVHVSGEAILIYEAQAGIAAAGDPISVYQDPIIESVFNDLKPAFTYVYFTYDGSAS